MICRFFVGFFWVFLRNRVRWLVVGVGLFFMVYYFSWFGGLDFRMFYYVFLTKVSYEVGLDLGRERDFAFLLELL